jgi:hypothetical protein
MKLAQYIVDCEKQEEEFANQLEVENTERMLKGYGKVTKTCTFEKPPGFHVFISNIV